MSEDLDDGPRATWTPEVGRLWKPLPDSKLAHGPGAAYDPAAQTLTFTERRTFFRPGFRTKIMNVEIVIAKLRHTAMITGHRSVSPTC